jgi:hypothetical protein
MLSSEIGFIQNTGGQQSLAPVKFFYEVLQPRVIIPIGIRHFLLQPTHFGRHTYEMWVIHFSCSPLVEADLAVR